MGIFSFLRRKKKGDGLNFQEGAKEAEVPEVEQGKAEGFNGSADFGGNEFGPRPSFADQRHFSMSPQLQQTGLGPSDVQLVLSKLDLINHRLEVIDRRLQVIEDIAKQSR